MQWRGLTLRNRNHYNARRTGGFGRFNELSVGDASGMAVEIGAIYDGTVVKILKYGAIVRLEDGASGLVHISEIADRFVHDVGDYLREGDAVKVKVTGDKGGGRFEMSAKQAGALEPIEGTPSAHASRPRASRTISAEFDDRLATFMKSSNQRLGEIRRGREVRRRGGRK